MLEKELKELITKEKFDELLEYFNLKEEVIQWNIYYDDRYQNLEQEKITIRVRIINNQIKLQIKLPKEKNGFIHIREETEKMLDMIPYQITTEELFSLTHKRLSSVFMIGILITERYTISLNDDITIFLDKNIYLNKTDYELEIEYTNQNVTDILSFFRDFGILFDGISEEKYSRFIKQLKEINNCCF